MARIKKTEYEKVTDEELVNLVEQGLMMSVGDWLNSSTLTNERQKSTLEYGMLATGHLTPQGVSQIVSSDTVEAVDGYLAVVSELLFNNNKIAKFTPKGKTPTDLHNSKVASDLVNYVIFKQNPGWQILNTWTKSGLLWKNSIIRWGFIEDFEYTFEEYEEIDQNALDLLLSDDCCDIVGTAEYEPTVIDLPDGTQTYVNIYKDVRIRKKVDKSRIKIENVPPENFRISKSAASLYDADFVGLQTDTTRGDIRKNYPDKAKDIDWDEVGDGSVTWATRYSTEVATRKILSGVEYTVDNGVSPIDTEANTEVTLTECWIRVDRDGDGIAELKHIIMLGSYILVEEDCAYIPLASFAPFEIPHEFMGLSVADMARPSTLAMTAILRGFVENVYLTNYSPKLADPNTVDFSALQNMKPKQLIPTNGNPNNAVAPLAPDTISAGTVPLLEFLQLHKEQSHGLSKAAQGLNDTLYVSGNSEQKLQMAMTAAQVRLYYMARRHVETAIKPFVEGIYRMIKDCLSGRKVKYYDPNNFLHSVDPSTLPADMLLEVDADVGENGNTNMLQKMQVVGGQVLPALQEAGAGGVVAPAAAANIAAKTLEALGLDPLDYIVDYTTPEFQQMAEQSRAAEAEAQKKLQQLEEQLKQLDIAQREATLALTNIQSKNAMQDNARQMVVAMDKSAQEWAKLAISARKEGIEPPERPDIMQFFQLTMQFVTQDASMPVGTPQAQPSEGPPAAVAPPVQ